jgi:hypothetical protein
MLASRCSPQLSGHQNNEINQKSHNLRPERRDLRFRGPPRGDASGTPGLCCTFYGATKVAPIGQLDTTLKSHGQASDRLPVPEHSLKRKAHGKLQLS